MPALSDDSLIQHAQAVNSALTSPISLIDYLRQESLEQYLAILEIAAAHTARDESQFHLVTVLRDWVDRRLGMARALGAHVAALDKAHRVLRYLAGIRLDIAGHPEPTTNLIRENVLRAFWDVPIKIDEADQGWALVDLCVRAGLLVREHDRWDFAHPTLVRYFAAEYCTALDHVWVSLRPQHRPLMKWVAAMLTRQGDEHRLKRFFDDMRLALSGTTAISMLDAADIMVEFNGFDTPAISRMREDVTHALRELTALPSNRLRQAVRESAERLGVNVGLSLFEGRPEEVVAEPTLEMYARDLPGLLNTLSIPHPAGGETDWLRDSKVVFGLIEQLRKTQPVDAVLRSAAWLRHAPLWEVEMVQSKGLFKSERFSAVEAVAQVATDPTLDEVSRTLARSVLATQESLSQLLMYGENYKALTITILLALDKRMRFDHQAQCWRFVE